ncbi:MAG: tetratricopeptide repeat protein [Gemmatimonadales bacterium]
MRFTFGEYQLDAEARALQQNGQRVHVEPKVFDLLVYLIEHRERVASPNELLDALWPGVSVTPAALSRAVEKARQAVGDDGEHQTVLRTEHGRGFRFVAEVSVAPPPEAALPTTTRARTRFAAATGVAALLLVAVVAWFLNRPTADATPARSIAVLPFVNLSGDPGQEYFSDGITEELVNTLTAIEGLRVVGRTSSFFFKGKDVDLRTIGETLGVSNILEGSVRRSRDRVRITAQLVSAADGFHLWSNSYDRELADIFEIQEEIAGAIADALEVELGFEITQSVARQTTDSLDAHRWLLRGRSFSYFYDVTNTKKALNAFEKAIELDPQYVPALVDSAQANLSLVDLGLGPVDDRLREAERRLDAAQTLDPDHGHLHATRGRLRIYRNDWAGVEEALQKAVELDPGNLYSQALWGTVLYANLGRPQEAVDLLQPFLRAHPLEWNFAIYYAEALAHAGRVEEAEGELRRIIEFDPAFSISYYYLGILDAFFRNQLAPGLRWWVTAFDRDPESVWLPVDAARLLLNLGDAASAERWVEFAERNDAGGSLGDHARFFLTLYRGNEAAAESISRRLAETVQRTAEGYQYLRDFAWLRQLQRTAPDLAMQVYGRLYPELLQDEPRVDAWNHAAAISLADGMRRSGDAATADSLLEKSLSVIMETTDPHYPPASATAYLLKGERDRALTALREAVDGGWRWDWWLLEREPIYEPLWDHPEFQAMMAEFKADMAAQLERVREMERNGELEPIPEVSATTQ